MQDIPKRLRNASPEEIAAYRSARGRKAKQNGEESCVLFRHRMRREAREGELDALIAKYRDEGKSRRQANYAAMRDMGFRSAVHERKEHKIAIGRAMMTRQRELLRQGQKKYRAKMRNKDLNDIMDGLPPNAPPEKEMDWVVSHRKLFHAALAMDDEEPEAVKLSADDIRSAPSQAAVTMLTVAMKDPVGWMEKKRDAYKAKTAAGTSNDDDSCDAIDDLDEVERILKTAEKQ